MPNNKKIIGNKEENARRDAAIEAGLHAERAYASNGRALGQEEGCDIVIYDAMGFPCTIQNKKRRNIAQYLYPPDGVFATSVRENYRTALYLIREVDFIKILKGLSPWQTEEYNKLLK